ncbi:MAG: DUF1631 family protein [Methylobacter sp.]|nr:MAG: DUF1631 family protein [Methylobacter sp.]
MTNFFLNDNRTIAMDNRQQINPGLSKTNRAEILGKVKPVFFQHFEQLVDDCCMRVDLEFGLQLGKNREKITKDQYIKLLEYLHSVRREIKQNYLLKVSDIFDENYQKTANNRNEQVDFSKVSLTSNDEVKENRLIALIIRDCEHSCYEELIALNKQLALQQGKQTIADSQNPIFPEKLINALVEVVKPLKLNTDGRIALYKAFEVNVFNQLGFIYRELIKWCETYKPRQLFVELEQSKDERPLLPTASVEQPSVEFSLLQEKLELWRLAHFPSAYDLISVSGNAFYEQAEIKNALQILRKFNDGLEPGEKKQPLKWRVLKKLEELSFSIDVKVLSRHDEDVLDLVALIFSEIERDELLQDAIKKAILQLEIPWAEAALGQYGVFTSQDNPVRQLLDELFAAGLFLNRDEHDDRLIQERIASAVKKITQDSGVELSGWTAEAGEFVNYMSKQKQRTRNIEQNAKQFMVNKQALASSRKIVLAAIENSMKGKMLPTAIVEFLRGVWSEVLLDAYTRKDDQPEPWDKSVRAMDELIISVTPPADDNERKQILKLLPGLIAELRKGLKQISYDKSAQSRFFKDLAVWHIILMDKKEKTAGDIATAVEGEKIAAVAITGDNLDQAGNLALDSWVAFNSESGRQWGKLLWKDAETGTMLFVGKNGVKILEIQTDALAKKLGLGQADIVKNNEKKITERVLSELMGL